MYTHIYIYIYIYIYVHIQEACGYSATAQSRCPCNADCHLRRLIFVTSSTAMHCRVFAHSNMDLCIFFLLHGEWYVTTQSLPEFSNFLFVFLQPQCRQSDLRPHPEALPPMNIHHILSRFVDGKKISSEQVSAFWFVLSYLIHGSRGLKLLRHLQVPQFHRCRARRNGSG